MRNLIQFFTRRARLEIIQGDITDQHVDAIVNAAKPSLLGGGGVDGAIHRAGGPDILRQCRILRAAIYRDGLPVGRATITGGGDLHAPYVIHTVGPDRRIGQTDPRLLLSCYVESLKAADDLKASTVAFPLISSGVYGWDTDDALRIALTAITTTRTRVRTVRLVLFDAATALAAVRILGEIGAFR